MSSEKKRVGGGVHSPELRFQTPEQEMDGILQGIVGAAKKLWRWLKGGDKVRFVTHGLNVCERCNALQGVYSTSNAPRLPVHRNCKCTLEPVDERQDAADSDDCVFCGGEPEFQVRVCAACMTKDNLAQLADAGVLEASRSDAATLDPEEVLERSRKILSEKRVESWPRS